MLLTLAEYFKPPNKTYCDACSTEDTEDYEHVVYALTMDKILKILRKKGFKIDDEQIENNLEECILKLGNRPE
ncbi:MAG: hypothetical protein QXT26_08165 [Thermoproteota archaeon]